MALTYLYLYIYVKSLKVRGSIDDAVFVCYHCLLSCFPHSSVVVVVVDVVVTFFLVFHKLFDIQELVAFEIDELVLRNC